MAEKLIGADIAPPDLRAKITGRARYAEDFHAEGMVFAKLLLSPMPHARVRSVDTRAAEAMEGVLGILRASELPRQAEGVGEAALTDEPLYEGESILAVAAVDETTAAAAVEAIRVDLEPLPFVLDPLESLRQGGPDARLDGNVGGEEGAVTLKWPDSVFAEAGPDRLPMGEPATEWELGDVDAAFAEAATIVEETIVHQSVTHHPMEPRSCMAYWQNGKLFLHGSTQSTERTRGAVAAMAGVDLEDVVMIGEYCGGGFGSKIAGSPIMAVPAVLSRKIGRPVMLRITRYEESYIGRARAGFQGWAKMGFRADGRMTALDLYLVQDGGPYGRASDFTTAGLVATASYDPETMRFRGVPVYTNTPPRSAQRAPGGAQIVAMLEPLVDKAARELGVDRLEIRKINAPDHTSQLGVERYPYTSAFVREALDLGGELFNWDEKIRLSGQRNGTRVTGIGMGLSPFTAGSSGRDGLLVIRPDGKLHVHQGIGNLGTHSIADTARPAAELLDLSWDQVVIVWGDTSKHLPFSTIQAGSQTTHAHTRANHAAGMAMVGLLQELAARELGGSPTAQHGHELAGLGALHEAGPQLFVVELALVEVLLEQRVVALGDGLHQLFAPARGLVLEVAGDLADSVGGHRLHVQDVDHAVEGVRLAHREGRDRGLDARVAQGFEGRPEIGPLAVDSVHEGENGGAALARGGEHLLAAGLDAVHRRENEHRAVEGLQGHDAVAVEVPVAGRVDEGEVVVVPAEAVDVRGDRCGVAVALFREVVEDRAAVVDASELGDGAGCVEDRFAEGGLAVTRVADQREVAGVLALDVLHDARPPEPVLACVSLVACRLSGRFVGRGPRGRLERACSFSGARARAGTLLPEGGSRSRASDRGYLPRSGTWPPAPAASELRRSCVLEARDPE